MDGKERVAGRDEKRRRPTMAKKGPQGVTPRLLKILSQAKGRPLTTDDILVHLPDVTLETVQQQLSRLKRRHRVLRTEEPRARIKGEKNGWTVAPRPKGRPGRPKKEPLFCTICGKEIKNWRLGANRQKIPNNCTSCRRLLLQVHYAKNRLDKGGIDALKLEVVIRAIVMDMPEARVMEQVRAVLDMAQQLKIDPDTIIRWGGKNVGT
jgi:hypothetical protein